MKAKSGAFILALPLLAAACGTSTLAPSLEGVSPTRQDGSNVDPVQPSTSPDSAEPSDPASEPTIDASLINRRVQDDEKHVFPSLIPPDGIRPIYNPIFSSAESVPLLDEELIIGVEFDGEAKAYPISVLRFSEMVNDELAGLPILVTW
jgi:hypothetical protein